MKFIAALLLLAMGPTVVNAFGESIPWIEDFVGLIDETMHDSGSTSWTAVRETGVFHIESEALLVNGGDHEGILQTGWIDVSATSSILFQASFTHAGNLEPEDYVKFHVVLPDGTTTQIGATVTPSLTATTISGTMDTTDVDAVRCEIAAKVNSNGEKIYITGVSVTEETAAAPEVIVSVGNQAEGETCQVTWTGNRYKDDGDCADLGSGPDKLECAYYVDPEADVMEATVTGTCEPAKCKPQNKKPGDGTIRLTICHRTCSETNPWVRITVDKNSWAGEEMCGHGAQHDITVECANKAPWDAWGGRYQDYIINDHGDVPKKDLCIAKGWCDVDGTYIGDGRALEKAYWREWEHACPYVRNGSCCTGTDCCGVFETETTPATATTTTAATTTADSSTTTAATTTAAATTTTAATTTSTTTTSNSQDGGGGGDPHFQRWGQEHNTFHGECDLVMVKSKLHNGDAFELQARTTIDTYFSYIETMAMKIGENILEFYKGYFYLNGVKLVPEDLPFSFGDYTVDNTPISEGKNPEFHQWYKVDLGGQSSLLLKFYKQYLTFGIHGDVQDFADSVGLMGHFHTGDMIDREGNVMESFDAFGFEWQVNPEDETLFRENRSPQLPFEKCRLPTAARPNRRLGANTALIQEAKAACAHVNGNGFSLCVDDIVQTGDVGLAEIW